jgi:glutathionyl-hydroquinone reductase
VSAGSVQTFLGREQADDGSFRRQPSAFRRWVSSEPNSPFPLAAGRYHLYVSRACPWAHRAVIGRVLMGLEDAIGLSFVDPIRDQLGWSFTGGEYVDRVNGFEFLSAAYVATDPAYRARVTVPVLWDKETGVIVDNESADILRMLGTVFAPLATHPVQLFPVGLRNEIDALNAEIYDNVNNAVYKAGFSRNQDCTSARCPHCSRCSTSSTGASPTAALCSARIRSRPTSACSPPWSASTPSTRSISSARCAS